MIIQWSIAAASVAFVGLVVYLIQTLQKGMVTLGETNKTLAEVRNAVHGLTKEANQLIHTANQITVDVKGKMKNVDPLLESAHDVGEVIQNVTHSFRQAAKQVHAAKDAPRNPQVQIKMK
ncbi:DUF948 domain-containing protein [Paenibacillus nasutitermitis]|uniref:DUF948 domain-containing protein n=1 Tax=Paenibacillus nasutitermitis TaxID=1652958 RepID=A0A917DZE1_9BACL|nr:DUF948 domain-containing protein [Paenibacillus nasutitermitis]GGD83175.1 hypothetical protein GCM10010911_46730 [Paenibacillus nasutitermitis]